MVTDIVHSASYAIVGPHLTLRVPVSPETRSDYVFEISEDERTLRMLENNTLWVHREERDAEAEQDCS